MGSRRHPYTDRGIRRMRCIRFAVCGNKAATQWQICADGRVYRPVCWPCDVELNRMVLEWAGDPEAVEKMAAYVKRG